MDVCGNHDAFLMIQTVPEKFGIFTEKKVEKDIESCDMQASMAHTTYEKFKILVSSKSLDNFSVFFSDVTNARTLFGPNRPGLKGKKFRQRPERVIPKIWIFHGIFIKCTIFYFDCVCYVC